MMTKNKSPLSGLYPLIVGLLLSGIFLVSNIVPGSAGKDVVVAKVVDGDTFETTGGQKIRLIGVDTPELHDNPKLYADVRRSGQDARTIKSQGALSADFTRQWLLGQRVHLEFDVQKKDKYGRLLAYVYLSFPRPPLADAPRSGYITTLSGKKWYFFNATLVQEGFASPMTIPPNVRHADLFQTLYEQAREYQRGLWQNGDVLKVKKKLKTKRN